MHVRHTERATGLTQQVKAQGHACVRAGIAGVGHVTSSNILNVNYPCSDPTSAKCCRFRLLQTLLYQTECDVSWRFI
jgi:hypothetical protein